MQFSKKKKCNGNCEETHSPEQEGGGSICVEFNELVEDFLIKTRRLLISGVIDEITSLQTCSYLQVFSLSKDPIYMYINSPGGCMSSGYAIIDQMAACRAPINTIVRGYAHSMGAMIAMYGTKGFRFATPNSSMMLHSIVIQAPADSIEKHLAMTGYLKDDYDKKVTDLAKRSKLSPKKLKELMRDTGWMSPKQAMKIGLIDGIWTPKMEQQIDGDFI
ncbi:hypothetical protein LCGC14_0142290 [marine sediment metagenome]|uniref:ATP-dependent Clp protease proteolytic subunit n=1 Tax=marine sediment metagenome TaxID=412755 RepID=A0A0F9V4R9_9ZZZZ